MKAKRLFTTFALIGAVFCLAFFAYASDTANVNESGNNNPVTTSVDLMKAISDAEPNVETEIVISGEISFDRTLVISSEKIINLYMNDGSTIDFSGVPEINNYAKGIDNKGCLSIAGNGNFVMSEDIEHSLVLIYCAENSNLNISGGTFNAVSCKYAYTIFNNGSITIIDGVFNVSANSDDYVLFNNGATVSIIDGEFNAAASGDNASTNALYSQYGTSKVNILGGRFYATLKGGGHWVRAIFNGGGKMDIISCDACATADCSGASFVYSVSNPSKVLGGRFSAIGGNGTNRAISCSDYSVTSLVTCGEFIGEVYKGSASSIDIHGGSFDHNPANYLAMNCSVVSVDSHAPFTVNNCAEVKFTPTAPSVAYNIDSRVVSVDFVSADQTTSLAVTSFDIFGAEDLPEGLTVASGDKKITITNNGCKEPGTYSVTVLLQNTDNRAASAVLSITVADPKASATTVSPIISGDTLPQNAVSADASGFATVELALDKLSGDFTAENLALDANNEYAVINPVTAAEILNDMNLSSATSADITSLTIAQSTNVGTNDKLIMTSFLVPAELFGTTVTDPSKLCVYQTLSGDKVVQLTYTSTTSGATDGTFIIQNEDGSIASSIVQGNTYRVSVFITDGGAFDLDGANGSTLTALFIDKSKAYTPATPTSSGSSGGCNAGFPVAALALASLAFVGRGKKK